MQFSTVLLSIASLVGLVSAVDNRLLFQVPAGETTTSFQPKFEAQCQTWPDAANLTFQTLYYQPGDFSGQNANTEVKLICSYHDEAGTTITFTKEVATSLGATPL
ncbi:hypothetical protein E1B28_000323 [Marasmius oreades]|uniref:Uncharacterized protein n=1 Tax=Marasmius oreades TaxID=181124 RepID=A0A9P7V111_9AGAR|nr:uncharacterized protein E1B28_000323 [Marasmius oreades]KAG7098365.1 hypothetical protein E1B28_000323 [Marasmius oreades]